MIYTPKFEHDSQVELERITTLEGEGFEYMYRLFEEAFPREERMEDERFFDFITSSDSVMLVIMYRGERVGFVTYVDLGISLLATYLAVDSKVRGEGIGHKFLTAFLAQSPKPIVMEVEQPTTEIARRRIAYYQRLGVEYRSEVTIFQPPHSRGAESVTYNLMESPAFGRKGEELLIESRLEEVSQLIHNRTYTNKYL